MLAPPTLQVVDDLVHPGRVSGSKLLHVGLIPARLARGIFLVAVHPLNLHARRDGAVSTDTGASSASDCVALQGRPVKGAPSGRVAKAMAQTATLDSPALPGGFRQL